ncbi:diaminobutyrate acetyltransferase [Streptomyces sp. NA04227]|uniref:diaminobutyrate acetyltransferase n=1 Tax=Streptomyces sp. NA04227 TaxID=2742136 RepID=UPI00158FB3B9|nr:diaminobutyrate acetyltransferase [Streptomyces sp. NA04227]QKW05802.1 diaminobutyrate acetyltransferase [Streptomyces sp. NA04227]
MTAAQADLVRARQGFAEMPEGLRLDTPEVEDGAAVWRIARDSKTLDLNSSYAYLLWCRDFAGTSVVARDESTDEPVAFITGYIRPERPQTLVVWQVAVDASHRGKGLAAALLEGLVSKVAEQQGIDCLETTISPDNAASQRLFTAFAERRGAKVARKVLFDAGMFPEEGHEPEVLYHIAPLAQAS